jgi:predicted secreted protein
MGTLKGQNLRILLGTSTSNLKCISVAQSCVLHVSAQVGESSSKDSTSEWQEQEITAINWDVQVDALVTLTADSSGTLVTGLTVGETYVVRMATTSGTNNRTPVSNALQVTGDAILSDLSIVASDKENTTFSAKFIGDGPLSPYQS